MMGKEKLLKIFNYIIGKLVKHMPDYDKLQHYYLGTWIAIFTAFLVNYALGGHFKPLVVISAVIAGILKELYDKNYKKTSIDLWDIYYTTIPSIFITAIMYF